MAYTNLVIPSAAQPVIDPQTGIMTRPWFVFLEKLSQLAVQGPAFGSVTSGNAVKWDGTTGRLVKE